MKVKLLNSAALLVLLGISTAALATGTMRCSGHIIDQGMTKEKIVEHCGQPTSTNPANSYWYYDHGYAILVTRIFFVGEKAEFIDDIPRDEME